MGKLVKGMYGECPHCGNMISIKKEGKDWKLQGLVGKKADELEEENDKEEDDDFFNE
ncbi:MAG: hypothetical protein GF317_14795 [Candidatus Lokiarchaeota archaeon]|nr:hypothetical protein [Candidatus Lokiarchaeota archaeon]